MGGKRKKTSNLFSYSGIQVLLAMTSSKIILDTKSQVLWQHLFNTHTYRFYLNNKEKNVPPAAAVMIFLPQEWEHSSVF